MNILIENEFWSWFQIYGQTECHPTKFQHLIGGIRTMWIEFPNKLTSLQNCTAVNEFYTSTIHLKLPNKEKDREKERERDKEKQKRNFNLVTAHNHAVNWITFHSNMVNCGKQLPFLTVIYAFSYHILILLSETFGLRSAFEWYTNNFGNPVLSTHGKWH